MKDILIVAKKELRACFSDKVIILQMLLLPFAMVFGYGILMSAMGQTSTETTDRETKAYVINIQDEFSDTLNTLGVTAAPDNDVEKYKQQIKDKELDMLIVFPDDFALAQSADDKLSDIEIYYNASNENSAALYTETNMVFTAMQPRIFTVNEKEPDSYNLFDSEDIMRQLLGGIIPAMVFMAVFMVCMNLAANSIAGDKEHGFLNTLLITPAKRCNLAAGKSVTILVVAIIASISAFVGMALSLPKIAASLDMEGSVTYSAGAYITLLLCVVTGAFVLAALLMIVSTLSKDVKQATTISPLFLFIFIIPTFLSTSEGFAKKISQLGSKNYFIPVWNSIKMMKDIIEMDYSAGNILIVCAVNIIAAVIVVFAVGRLFENEKIVNG